MGEGLLFLPDISGFTNFINETSSEHSKHIIAELLEILIDQNEIGLELAEIEGDALFFYKEGPLPSRQEILSQAHKMYTAFHSHLLLYDNLRICSCGACKSAVDLKLKFIVHAGPLDYIEVRGFKKPHGKDVIVAHRLMKNSVPGDEYILMSDAVHDGDYQVEHSLTFQRLTDTYDSGKVDYSYSDISSWQSDVTITNTTPIVYEESNPLILEKDIEVASDEIFTLVSDLRYRSLWNKDASFKYEEDRVNRVGFDHYCLIDNRDIHFKTVIKEAGVDQLVYGESTGDFPLMKQVTSYFILSPSEQGTNVKVEVHLTPKNVIGRLIMPILKLRILRQWKILLDNLKSVAEQSPMISGMVA